MGYSAIVINLMSIIYRKITIKPLCTRIGIKKKILLSSKKKKKTTIKIVNTLFLYSRKRLILPKRNE